MNSGSETGLVPALVVVDSRNIYHQTEAATGHAALPDVAGVVEAMKDYGFDALEVHVGLALPRSQDAQVLKESGATNRAFKAQVEAAGRGQVLLGQLHRKEKARGGYSVEEKQVDVACAVDICRHASQMHQHNSPFKAIVVLSQDTDLSPAYRYAEEIGVPLVLAAHERIEQRGFKYMLLTERAFRKIGRTGGGLAGHALRAAVAAAMTAPPVFEQWTLEGRDPHRERMTVVRSDGLRGVVRQELIGGAAIGDSLSLRVAGVDFGRRRNQFPVVTCTSKTFDPNHDHTAAFETTEVVHRRSLDEVVISPSVFKKDRLSYPAGGVEPGTRVLVDCTEPNRPLIVGALNPPADRDLAQAAPCCVTAIKALGPTKTLASAGERGRVLVQHSASVVMRTDARYAAVVVTGGAKPIAKLISSDLP